MLYCLLACCFRMVGVELTIGGWFAKMVISNVVAKARSYFGKNYDLHKDTHSLLDNLEASLPQVQAVIKVAEQRPIDRTALGMWLQQLKDAAFEAEDVLDDFEAKIIQKNLKDRNRLIESTSSALMAVKTWIFSDADLQRLKGAVCKLEKLCASVGDFIDLLKLSLHADDAKQGGTIHGRRETSPRLLNGGVVFGREEERDLILDMILWDTPMPREEPESSTTRGKGRKGGSSSRGVQVIPIVGVGGVGKTTLAQVIYNDQRVKDQFGLRGWVSLSDNYAVRNITQEILLSFSDSRYPPIVPQMTLDQAQAELGNRIRKRIFLLVLDDVWEGIALVWTSLSSILSEGAPGSVVLVTTQRKIIAKMIRTTSFVMLDVLPRESFWPLFQHHAFSGFEMGRQKRIALESIGKEIAEKLHGLPLAAEAIGKLLRLKSDEEGGWERVLESDWWNLDAGSIGILPSLGLVYQHLDAELRQCFAYCSIFPKNYFFEKDRLVQMWIANGFIVSDDEDVRLEDIGREWFDQLLDRSFFQPTTWKNWYIMPGLMRDLAIAVSSKECHMMNNAKRNVPRCLRHLSVDSDDLNVQLDDCNRKSLRTILIFGGHGTEKPHETLRSILNPLPSLRVLDLSYINMRTVHPCGIDRLSHLRFLDLSFTGIEMLPKLFSGLCHLQVLYLRGCQFSELPKDMCKLINLRHLYANGETLSLIYMIGKLTNLQELEVFRVGKKKGHRITELKDLSKIGGQLSIENLGEVTCKEEAVSAKLAEKKHLKSLVLSWQSTSRQSSVASYGDREILEGLQPHVNLEELIITGYMGCAFPSWMGRSHDLTKLRCVELRDCKELEMLPPLGQLPLLEILRLESLSSVVHIGGEFYGSSDVVFPSLEELTFKDMPSLEKWSGIDAFNSFPYIRKVHIVKCSKLGDIPLKSSLVELVLSLCAQMLESTPRCLSGLANLTRLTVQHCPGVVSLPCPSLVSLEALYLHHCKKLCFYGGLRQLIKLKNLEIYECIQVDETSDEAHLVGEEDLRHQEEQFSQSLISLAVDGNFFDKNNGCAMLGKLPSLQTMVIYNSSIPEFTVKQETWLEQLTSLRVLGFEGCSMTRAPSSLATLSSLKKLTLDNCPQISSLPASHLPPRLQELLIFGCPQLSILYAQEGPAAWPNIPSIRIQDFI